MAAAASAPGAMAASLRQLSTTAPRSMVRTGRLSVSKFSGIRQKSAPCRRKRRTPCLVGGRGCRKTGRVARGAKGRRCGRKGGSLRTISYHVAQFLPELAAPARIGFASRLTQLNHRTEKKMAKADSPVKQKPDATDLLLVELRSEEHTSEL